MIANITITSQDGLYLDEVGDGAICQAFSVDAVGPQPNQHQLGMLKAVVGEPNKYTCEIVLPAFSVTGRWYFDLRQISDNYNHYLDYWGADGITDVLPDAITEINNTAKPESVDKVGPIMTAFSAAPTFNTSASSQTITATYTVSDPAGVRDDSMTCKLNSTTTSQYYQGGMYNDTITKNGDQYTCTFTLPVGSAIGAWQFNLLFSDYFSNGSEYNARYINGDSNYRISSWPISHTGAIVTNEALNSDEAGPEITNIFVTPTTLNTDNRSRKITALFDVSEEIVLGRSQCELHGNSQYNIATNLLKMSGNQYMCEAILPTNSAGGRWNFYLRITDALGNGKTYESFLNNQGNNQWNLPFPGVNTGFFFNEATSTVKQIVAYGTISFLIFIHMN